ncbi:MAG: Ig-like domain-containing protein, partial [Desulfuromonadales bacterium]
MRTQLLKMFTVVFMLLFAFGCGGGGGGSDSGDGGTTGPSGTPLGPPATLVLSSGLTTTGSIIGVPLLARGGQTAIKATITDASGLKVADGTVVVFSATAGSITATATTTNGVATATYLAGTARGVVTVTATSQGVIDDIDIEVAASAGP